MVLKHLHLHHQEMPFEFPNKRSGRFVFFDTAHGLSFKRDIDVNKTSWYNSCYYKVLHLNWSKHIGDNSVHYCNQTHIG